MLAKVTLRLLTSSIPYPTSRDLRKTATILNKRMQQLLNLHFHKKKHKAES